MHLQTRQATRWLIISVGIFAILATTINANEDEWPCTRMERNCRLQTQRTMLDGNPFVNLNISCFCEDDEPEDVWGYLDKLSTRKCSWLPTDDNGKVNLSTIHITGCLIQQEVFPKSILQLARRTEHLEIIFNKCPYVRLGAFMQAQKHVSQLNVSFTDSKLSGLPRGWISDAQNLEVKIERCEVPIIESKAFAGFQADAEVDIQIVDTNISTIKMVAFELPSSGRFSLRGGEVMSWNRTAFSGGEKVELDDVKILRLLGEALNLHGVRSFRMSSCRVAELLAEAVIDQDKGSVSSAPGDSTERTATIEHNRFIKANGDAFVNLCKFSSLLFQNNTFLDVIEPPLRLQNDYCETKRNWKDSVFLTGLGCTDCEHFSVTNEQSCAIYQNAYCISCEKMNDSCNAPLLQYLIQDKCYYSHSAIADSLKDACKFDPSAPQKAPRSFNGGCLITENPFIILISVLLMMLRQCL